MKFIIRDVNKIDSTIYKLQLTRINRRFIILNGQEAISRKICGFYFCCCFTFLKPREIFKTTF